MNVNTYIFIACTRFLELQRYKSVTKIVCNKKITDFYPNLVDKMVCKHWSAVVIKGHKFESPVPSTSMHIYKYRCTYTHTIVCGFSNKCQQIHFYSHIKVYECQWLYWLCGAIKCTHSHTHTNMQKRCRCGCLFFQKRKILPSAINYPRRPDTITMFCMLYGLHKAIHKSDVLLFSS